MEYNKLNFLDKNNLKKNRLALDLIQKSQGYYKSMEEIEYYKKKNREEEKK